MFSKQDRLKYVKGKMESMFSVEFLMLLDGIATENNTSHLIYLLQLVSNSVVTGNTAVLDKIVNMDIVKKAARAAEQMRDIAEAGGNVEDLAETLSMSDDEDAPGPSRGKSRQSEESKQISKLLDDVMEQKEFSKSEVPEHKPKISTSSRDLLTNMLRNFRSPKSENDQKESE